MKKERFFIVLIVLLTVLNIAQIGAHFFRPMEGRGHGPKSFKDQALKTLSLDKNQKEQFLSFGHEHRIAIDELNHNQRRLLGQYFEAPKEEVLKQILDIETQKIKVTQNNFEQVKGLLNSEQLKHYDTFQKQALNVILK